MKAEVQAHSRLLAAMAVHPTRPLFATAAEDATVAVWALSDDQSQVSNECATHFGQNAVICTYQIYFNLCKSLNTAFHILNLVCFCCLIAVSVPQVHLEFVQVLPLLSLCWNNTLLTGLAFTGTTSNSIAVAAYDTDEIRVWAIE